MNNDIPHRDDKVAAWIKRRRDECLEKTWARYELDCLLDDYRDHADTGTPLDAGGVAVSEPTCPPRTEPDEDERLSTAAEAEAIAEQMFGPCERCER